MANFNRSLWSIAMAGAEAGHPSHMKGHLAYLAIGERKTRIVDAATAISRCFLSVSLEPSALTGGRLGASGAYPIVA